MVTFADELEPHARGLAIFRIGEREIGQVHRRLLGDDAAVLLRGLLLVTLDHVDAAHHGAALLRTNLDDLAGAPLVASGGDDHLIALADLGRHYSTSGASEMIFM